MSATIPALYAETRHSPQHDWTGNPDLWLYRDRTTALLRRYLYLSVEIGRLPSLLGREFFRARVSSYHVTTFEDAVIFVHDVERSLDRLNDFCQQVIARVVLQEYTELETAHLLHCSLRTVSRRLPDALDQLTAIFLTGGLLQPFVTPPAYGPCQYGEIH
jgi:DNA-directed RNA polymerase specialized sigma24 family protein